MCGLFVYIILDITLLNPSVHKLLREYGGIDFLIECFKIRTGSVSLTGQEQQAEPA
jgi:hypothetical protein